MIKLALIDFTPIAFAQYHGCVARDEDLETKEDKIHYLKYMILSKLADIQQQIKANQSYLCFDSKSWRKKAFKFYKAKRAIKRADNPLDYEIITSAIAELEPILKETNYKCIKVDQAEADDVIAVLSKNLSKIPEVDKIIIVSRDKDFQQLTNDKVHLYNYFDQKIITCEDKETFMVKMIITGDSGDGIPNILSDDDTFINSDKRQKGCGEKKIQKILSEGLENLLKDTQIRKNYERNQKLILLNENHIPSEVWKNIELECSNVDQNYKRKNVFIIGNMFRSHNFDGLVSRINDFA